VADVLQLRAHYKCPVCKSTEEDEYLICNNPACPDNRDQGVLLGGDAKPTQTRVGFLVPWLVFLFVLLAYRYHL
jgi:hypothetical protein